MIYMIDMGNTVAEALACEVDCCLTQAFILA